MQQLALQIHAENPRGRKAQAVKVRPGKRQGTVYVRTKSGSTYRFNWAFRTREAQHTFIAKVKEAKGRIDTRQWTKVA